MKKNLLLYLIGLFTLTQISVAQQIPYPKEYVCYHIDKPIVLDGKLDDSLWQKVDWTDDFMDIQGPEFPKPRYQTRVKMLWDEHYLYVAAYMQEPHIWAYLTEDEMIMYHDNDFEIFIDPDGDNHNYYEFEFNALNKKWDLFLERPYRDQVEPDLKWECKGLRQATQVYGSINNPKGPQDSAWTMEIAIPLSCIQNDVHDGMQWRINFSRVEWDTKIRGRKYKKLKKPENNWVWSPQWAINMHRPEYWGYVQFSALPPGTKKVEPRRDPLWDIKIKLMQLYYWEKKHYKTYGRYTDSLPDSIDDHILINTYKEKHYIAGYHQDGGQLNVNETGRLWRTKMYASPRFWIWLHKFSPRDASQWDSLFTELSALGIQGVLYSGSPQDFKAAISRAKKYNIRIHAWMWTLNRPGAPDSLMSVNALGKSLAEEKAYVDYYKFLSPALPETYKLIRKNIEMLQRIDGLSGIHLDYIRYVDVFLPTALQGRYHLKQDSIMPRFDYGYHPSMLELFKEQYGHSPYDIPDYANDSLWQQFRMNRITDIVDSLYEQMWSSELNLSAAVFPDPEMSRRMVRQDWGRWKLDYYFPMAYNKFYNGGSFWIEQRMKVSRQYLPEAKIFCGLYLPHAQSEEELTEYIEAAMAGGASGIAFFDFYALKAYHKAAIKSAAKKYGRWVK